MRARFTDADGGRLWRAIPYVLPFLAFVSAFLVPSAARFSVVLGSFALFNLIGLAPWHQRRPRNAELEVAPGVVRVRKSGTRNQRIRTADITGATTTRTSTGVVLTFQHARRRQPITIEVASDADAEKIRQALGIGHGGFGTLAWRTVTDSLTRIAWFGRLVAALLSLLGVALMIFVSNESAMMLAGFLQFGFIGAIVGFVGLVARGADPSIVMSAGGLRLNTPRGWFALPYQGILNLEDHPRGFVFDVPEPYGRVAVERAASFWGGISAADGKMLVHQIRSAADRARGLGPRKNDPTGRIDVLRRAGESPRDWLARLDMTGQTLAAGAGYRGNNLDADDLWAILEDPEAEADLRAAAARVLRHAPAPGVRVRIDAAIAAVRDEGTSHRLRIAIADDIDGASQELAHLDATEARLGSMRRITNGR